MTQTLDNMQDLDSVKNEKTSIPIGSYAQDVNTTCITTSISNDLGLESDVNVQADEHPSLPLSGFVTREEHTSQPVKALKRLNCKDRILNVKEAIQRKHIQDYKDVLEIELNERISFEDAVTDGLTIEIPEEALQKIKNFQPVSDGIITTASEDNFEEKIKDNDSSNPKANIRKILLQNQAKRESEKQAKEVRKLNNIAPKKPKQATPPKKTKEAWRVSLEKIGEKGDVIFKFQDRKAEKYYQEFYSASKISKGMLKTGMEKVVQIVAHNSIIGQAEILKYDDGRSVRLNKADRVVYDLGRSYDGKKEVIIIDVGDHYSKSETYTIKPRK